MTGHVVRARKPRGKGPRSKAAKLRKAQLGRPLGSRKWPNHRDVR